MQATGITRQLQNCIYVAYLLKQKKLTTMTMSAICLVGEGVELYFYHIKINKIIGMICLPAD